MASASAWGIDIGNRALKAIKLVREGDGFRIDDFEIIEHEQILSVAGDNRESLLKAALAHFVEKHQTRGSVVGVSVSGQSSFARFIKLPPVEPKKIPEIVRFEAIQQIPFPLDEVEWSYQLFQEKDSPDVEVGIFAMRKDLVNRHLAFFTDLGLNVQTVQMHPLAIYNGMYYDDRVAQTTMFMDCGAENTDLIIADGQTVWLRSLPIGGNSFTETLAKSFKLSFAKAEELKRNAATSKYAKQIFQAMRPVFADLVAEIQRSIGFYASVHRDSRIQRIVALGSTFQLPGLQKYLQQNLQLPAEKLDAFKALPPTDAKLATALSENTITLTGAYGLALQALGEAKIASSLLPERIRRAKMWQEKTKWFAAAAAAILLGAIGVAGVYTYNSYSYDQNSITRSSYQKVLKQGKKLANQWVQDVQSFPESERNIIVSLRSLTEYHGMWLDFISQVLTQLPNKSIAELKRQERPKRELVSVHSFQSEYRSDLTDVLAPTADLSLFVAQSTGSLASGQMRPIFRPSPSPMALGPAPDITTEAAPVQRGFIVTIRGSTPRAFDKGGSEYIVTNLVKKLQDMKPDPQLAKGKSYYVAKADLISSGKRAPARPADNSTTPGGGAMFSRFGPRGYGTGNTSEGTPELIDADILAPASGGGGAFTSRSGADLMPTVDAAGKPLFDPLEDRHFPGETVENDTVFTVVAIVVMDPVATKKE